MNWQWKVGNTKVWMSLKEKMMIYGEKIKIYARQSRNFGSRRSKRKWMQTKRILVCV